MDSEWQKPLNDSTPLQYRERGFVVYLDTVQDAYYIDDFSTGDWVSPGDDIYFFMTAFNEPNPFANNIGARYPVARFHTHTPEEYSPAEYERDTGPLFHDEPTANSEKTPGFVYDYIEAVIEGGYAETNNAKVYDFGPTRKATLSHEE